MNPTPPKSLAGIITELKDNLAGRDLTGPQRNHLNSSIERLLDEMGNFGLDLGRPTEAPITGTLLPCHIQTIDNLVSQAKIGTTPDSPLWQQAETVRDILLRYKAGHRPEEAAPADTITLSPRQVEIVRALAVQVKALPPGPPHDGKRQLAGHVLSYLNAAEPLTDEPELPAPTAPYKVLVAVYWEDSKQPGVGWRFLDELKEPAVVRVQSVGWIVAETDTVLYLAPNLGNLGEKDAQGLAMIDIPKRCIYRRAILGLSREVKP